MIPELPQGQWWLVMTAEEYMAFVERRHLYLMATSGRFDDLLRAPDGYRITHGDPIWPRRA